MTDCFIEADDGATPLTPEERDGLLLDHITLRRELNEAEQLGILAAERWAFSRRRNVLDEKFLRALHSRMFGDIWKWAGTFRTTARNIGVEAGQIAIELRKLLDDTSYQIEQRSLEADQIIARFHHRLVWIHPFPNGNGRHARLAADILCSRLGLARCTWGRANLTTIGDTRQRYIAALRAADNHDFELLLSFIRD